MQAAVESACELLLTNNDAQGLLLPVKLLHMHGQEKPAACLGGSTRLHGVFGVLQTTVTLLPGASLPG